MTVNSTSFTLLLVLLCVAAGSALSTQSGINARLSAGPRFAAGMTCLFLNTWPQHGFYRCLILRSSRLGIFHKKPSFLYKIL